jgi:hypothetical protein
MSVAIGEELKEKESKASAVHIRGTDMTYWILVMVLGSVIFFLFRLFHAHMNFSYR